MTNVERMQAGEADLATVSVSEGMDALSATGSLSVVTGPDATTRRSARSEDS
jgi:hypothetical protein